MATSTNFGWTEPDDTDLVKNGASAMRTLGNAIDSSLYTLSGGIAGKNRIINGGFDIWQRGTSISVSAATASQYVADRWVTGTSANQACTISRQATGDTTNLPNIQYCMRYQRNSGQTGTTTLYTFNNFETVNSIPYAGQTVTLSFYARRGADFSATSYNISARVFSGTGTDQNRQSGAYTGDATVATTTVALTTTWQRFTVSGTVGATATELAIGFWFTPTGTAGANDYFEITGVQLELGSSATPFSRAGGTIQGELAAAQRYYWRAGGDSVYQGFANGFQTSTTAASVLINNPVTMRVAPTSIDFASLLLVTGNNQGDITNLVIGYAGKNAVRVTTTNNAFGAANTPVSIIANNSTSAYIGLNAEL